MRHSDLAIIFSTAGFTGSDKELRENIWAQTTALLTPSLGKAFNRFEPASEVWEQKIKEPFTRISRCRGWCSAFAYQQLARSITAASASSRTKS